MKLQKRFEDSTKLKERQNAQELRKVQAAQKHATKTGEQHEESLIEESLNREEALTERVSRLERELNAKTKVTVMK